MITPPEAKKIPRNQGLSPPAGFGAKLSRIGVIDIGSNSVRLVIYERYGASAVPVFNEKLLAGLGRDLRRTGKLYPLGAAQALKALIRFKALAKAHGLDSLIAVATAAMRDAADGPDFIKAAKAQAGLTIRILSGEQEAQAAAYGVIHGDKRSSGIVADLGGSSLELISVHDTQVGHGKTFPVGPFAMVDGPFNPKKIAPVLRKALSGIKDDFSAKGKTLYLVGGAWRNLALINNDRKRYPLQILHNYSMSPEAAMELAEWASVEAAGDLMTWPGMSSARAETLPYSALVLKTLLTALKPKRIVISPTGLREGILYQEMSAETRERVALFDACRHLAMGNIQGLNFGGPLFDWLKHTSDLFPCAFDVDAEDRLRRAACLLVGMGKGLHPDHRADLVFNDVLYAPLAGLTHKERAYLALMLYSSYRGNAQTPNDAAIDYHLMEREKHAARVYGTAMRLGTVISGRTADILTDFDLSAQDNVLWLNIKEGRGAMLNRRGVLRLRKLADMIGVKSNSTWETAQIGDYQINDYDDADIEGGD